MAATLRTARFDLTDQERFAALSGDYNPLHLDADRARRELFGAPVVHGVRLTLACLDALGAQLRGQGLTRVRLRSLSAEFQAPAYVGQALEIGLDDAGAGEATFAVRADGQLLARVRVGWEPMDQRGSGAAEPTPTPARVASSPPNDLPFEALVGRRGALPLLLEPTLAAQVAPDAAAILPAATVATLLALTRLVGMECPGLRSILSGLTLTFAGGQGAGPTLDYEVTAADRRFSLVTIAVRAPSATGTVTTFYRPGPQAQPLLATIRTQMPPHLCRGQTALVIGGSRGLGEVTAKLVAAGGGRLILTYASGRADGDRVGEEIRAGGGRCEVIPWDAQHSEAGAAALRSLEAPPTHLYYFATPKIFVAKPGVFDAALFDRFASFYVSGFHTAYAVCRSLQPEMLTVLYPSTTALDDVVPGLAEYSAAKAAGEVVCRQLSAADPRVRVHVERLPRIATDQTTSLLQYPAASALDVMAPIVARLAATQGRPHT